MSHNQVSLVRIRDPTSRVVFDRGARVVRYTNKPCGSGMQVSKCLFRLSRSDAAILPITPKVSRDVT